MSINDEEKDFEEKLIFRQLLWKKGYTVFINVPVISTREVDGEAKREDVTDVDVLGFSFDDTLSRKIEIADCKSNPDSHNRLLWLNGLKSYLDADKASFVSRKVNNKYSAIASRLKVDIWTIDEITTILSAQEFDSSEAVFNLKLIVNHEKLFLSKDATPTRRKFINYLRYYYWLLPLKNRLQSTMYNFEQVAKIMQDNAEDRALIHEAVKRIGLSLLDLSGFIISNNSGDIHRLTEQYLLGTIEEIEMKKALHKVHKIAESKLYPEYYQELLELVSALVRRPDCAKNFCRLLESSYYDEKYVENLVNIATKSGDKKSLIDLKIAKDMISFICKGTGLPISFFDKIMKA